MLLFGTSVPALRFRAKVIELEEELSRVKQELAAAKSEAAAAKADNVALVERLR
jgi:homeobox protein cut-like